MTGQRYQNVILTVIAILLFAHLAIRTGEPAFAQEAGSNVNGPIDVRLVNGKEPVKVMLWAPSRVRGVAKPAGTPTLPFYVRDH